MQQFDYMLISARLSTLFIPGRIQLTRNKFPNADVCKHIIYSHTSNSFNQNKPLQGN